MVTDVRDSHSDNLWMQKFFKIRFEENFSQIQNWQPEFTIHTIFKQQTVLCPEKSTLVKIDTGVRISNQLNN